MTNFKLNLSDFLATPQGRRAVPMLQKRGLPVEAFVEAIRHEVIEALPGLIAHGRYTTKDLCGHDLWSRLHGQAAPRCAGMCLSYLVEIGAVPLVLATNPKSSPRKYSLP
jgi:hypothetical protein